MSLHRLSQLLIAGWFFLLISEELALAQVPSLVPPVQPREPIPLEPSLPLPSLETPVPSSPTIPTPDNALPSLPQETVVVKSFEFEGSTIFSREQLAAVTQTYTQRPITYAELLQAVAAVTQLYIDKGYQTSGAYLPAQKVAGGVVTIAILEGSLAEINVKVEGKLNSDYIRDRLELAADKPLNVPRLLEALQLLQLNPIIQRVQSELATGARPGTSVLNVTVAVAPTFSFQALLDNGQVPSVGSFRRGLQTSEANLFGLGDRLGLVYRNTDGSNDIDLSYTLPVNPRNGTVTLAFRALPSKIIEPPIDQLGITSDYNKYGLTYRQPVIQTPFQELALGLTFDYQENQTFLGVLGGLGFPLSPGANQYGQTHLASLRFFQEWTQRNEQEVIALRSQFNFGLEILGATEAFDGDINPDAPQSNYFAWRGQAQWVRLLAPDTLLVARTDLQLAGNPLVPLEQFALGGVGSVMGYRQNLRLTDNGWVGSLEARLPILRLPEQKTIVQLIPFVDVGTGWNVNGLEFQPNTLASLGVGLQWQTSDYLTVRLDFGFPLVDTQFPKNTWQENGIYFSVILGR